MSLYWQAESRFDWRAYMDEKGAMPALRSRKDEFILECPDCGKPKLAVNVERKRWRCFVCDVGGYDSSSLVKKIEQCNFIDAINFIVNGAQRPIGNIEKVELRLGEKSKNDLNRKGVFKAIPWPGGFELVGVPSRGGMAGAAYCVKRGILDYVAAEMRLGVSTSGRFRGRLIFPVFDSGGRLIFYQGRAMWDAKPFERHIKTLSVRSEPGCAGAGDVLLNLQYLIDRDQTERVAIVEGPIDCAHAWPDAVATFGKKISDHQIELLVRAGVKAVDICWDSDARAEAEKVAPVLSSFFSVRIVQFPAGHDPGDLTKDQIDDFRARAYIWGSGDRLLKVHHSLGGSYE